MKTRRERGTNDNNESWEITGIIYACTRIRGLSPLCCMYVTQQKARKEGEKNRKTSFQEIRSHGTSNWPTIGNTVEIVQGQGKFWIVYLINQFVIHIFIYLHIRSKIIM